MAAIFLQNVQSVSAAALRHITLLENKTGPYYRTDINGPSKTNERIGPEYGPGLSNLRQFTYNREDSFEDEKESSFIYEESVNANTTIYVSQEDADLKRMEITSEPSNYRDENLAWRPIETTIEEADEAGDYPFHNETNTVRSYYGFNPEQNGILFVSDGLQLSYKPVFNEEQEAVQEPQVYENQILYPLSDEVNIRYTVHHGFIKEDILLNTPGSTNRFRYELHTNGRIEGVDGNLFILNEENELKWILSAPKAYDGAGKETAVDLAYEDGFLTYTVDEEWLKADDRVYPVVIDPSLAAAGHEAYDVSIVQNLPYTTVGNVDLAPLNWKLDSIFEARMYIGKDPDYGDSFTIYRLKNGIMDQLNGKYIKKAVTSFQVESASAAGKINACPIKEAVPVAELYYANIGNTEDLLDVEACVEAPYETSGRFTVDTTPYVKNVIENHMPNGGLFMMLEEQGSQWLRLYACEYFNYELAHYGQATSGYYPGSVIEYYDHPDVAMTELNDFTYHVRPFVKYNYAEGAARFIALGVDGKAPPKSDVHVSVKDGDTVFNTQTMEAFDNFFHYPDYPSIPDVPDKWTEPESNYQAPAFIENFEVDKLYDIEIYAKKGSEKSEVKRTWFQLYESKKFDVLSNIANYYGVDIATLKEDNNLQDELITEGNLLFLREPKRHKGKIYPSTDLSRSEKEQIDAALRGRGVQCEFGNEPINLNTGNFLIEAEDLSLQVEGETFSFTRTYNALSADVYTVNGYGWTHNLLSYIGISKEGAQVVLPDSKMYYFVRNTDGTYTNRLTNRFVLTEDGDHFTLYDRDENKTYAFLHTGELASITNAHNRKTVFEYTPDRQLGKVIFPNGFYLELRYGNGLLSAVEVSDGTRVAYQYDADDQLTAYTDQTGQTIRYRYDQAHRITSWTNRKGELAVANTYDEKGRVIRQEDGLGNVYRTEYTDDQTINTDPNGNQTVYRHDRYGATTSVVYADGSGILKQYEKGLLTYEKTATGLQLYYEYTDDRDLIKKSRSDGFAEEWSYDDRHNVLLYTDSEGHKVSYTYDADGNETSQTDALGNTIRKTYDASSNRLSETDGNGNVTTYSYNANNQVCKVRYPDGSYETYAYDSNGYLANTTDADGNTTYLVHNERNELVLLTNPDGSTIKYEYDPDGNRTAVEDENGYVTRFAYDLYGRLLSSVDPLQNRTEYAYDANGNCIRTTNPDGSTITKIYDSENRPITVFDRAHRTDYTYGVYGVETITNERNQIRRFEYDDLGNVIRIVDFDGSVTTNEYDRRSRLLTTTDAKGNRTSYVYDLLDRVVKETDGRRVLTYAYDANGNRIRIDEQSDASFKTTGQVYDAMNRVVEEIDALGQRVQYTYEGSQLASVTDKNGNTTTYAYDSRGNRIRETLADGSYRTWSYDSAGNKTAETDTNGNTTSFVYDADHNPIQIVDKEGNATNYVYDNMNRQASSTSPLGYQESYTYDADGQITSKSVNGRIVETYVYDAYGNCIEETVNRLTTTYAYDAFNNRIQKTDPYGLTTAYTYDAYHRLIETRVNPMCSSSWTYDTYDNVLSETDLYGETRLNRYDADLNRIASTFHNRTTTYTYDLLNREIKEEDSLGNCKEIGYDAESNILEERINGQSSYYAYDADQNRIKETDTLGNVTEHSYDHEGNLLSTTDANGHRTTFTYNKNGLLLSTAVNGTVLSSNEYNEDSLLIKETDGEGYCDQYVYDSFRNRIRSVDKRGYLTEYTYDEYFNLLSETDSLGYRSTNTYNERNQLIETKDAQNNVYTYEYDVFNNRIKTTNPLKAEYRCTYNALNQLESTVDERGLETSYTYTSFNAVRIVSKDGETAETRTYDSYGRLIAKTDSLGNRESYTYDREDNLLSIRYPNGAKETFVYDAKKQVIAETDVLGTVTEFAYDGMGNRITRTVNHERLFQNEYDDRNNLVSTTDANNNRTTFVYNNRNEQIETVDALGHVVKTEYAPTGEIVATTDENGNRSQNVIDEAGRVIQTVDPEGHVTTNTYDSLGRLSGVQNPKGYRVSYTYNALGSLVKERNGNREVTYTYNRANDLIAVKEDHGKKETYTYDNRGNVLTHTRKDGTKIQYSYDSEDHMLHKNGVSYVYDGMGSLVRMEDESGTTTYTYNPAGSVTSVEQSGKTVRYVYNAYDELVKIIYPDQVSATYVYDANSNLIEASSRGLTVRYAYDALNREVGQTGSDGIVTVTAYDPAGNTTHIQTTVNGFSYFEASYSYNGNHSLIKEEIKRMGESTIRSYTYNENDELTTSTTVKDGQTSKTEYILTLEGNVSQVKDGRTDSLQTFNEAGQLTKSTHGGYTFTYVYDDNGNRVLEKRSDGRSRTYTYNEWNRLIRLKDFDDVVYTYAYDGLDHRLSMTVQKQERRYETGSYQVEDKMNTLIRRLRIAEKEGNICLIPYYGEGSPVDREEIEERLSEAGETWVEDASYNRQSSFRHTENLRTEILEKSETRIQYINDYTGEQEQVLAEIQEGSYKHYFFGNQRLSSERFRYISDYSGSIVMTLNPGGTVHGEYEYGDYGARKQGYDPFNAHTDPIGFNGEYHEPSGLVYLRARYVDPYTFVFISEDTYRGVLYDPDSRKRYAYVRNNPKKYSDGDGHRPLYRNGSFHKAGPSASAQRNKRPAVKIARPVVGTKAPRQPVRSAKRLIPRTPSSSFQKAQTVYGQSPKRAIGNGPVQFVNSAQVKERVVHAGETLSKTVKKVASARQSAHTTTAKLKVAKVHIQARALHLNNTFRVVKGALANRVRGMCSVPKKKASGSNAWDKVLERVGGAFEILAGHVDEHLEDIASIGLAVGAAAIVIGAAGFAIGAIGAQPAAVMALVKVGGIGTIGIQSAAVLPLVKAGGTLAVIGGGTAMAAGAAAAVSGFLQVVTGALKKTLDGIELNEMEAEGRIQSGLTNTLYGIMTMMVGKIVYGVGQSLLNVYEVQKRAEEKTRRPTWKESEDYVCEKENIPKKDRQKVYLEGKQTENNVRLPGSSVPEGAKDEEKILYEVKNYNLKYASSLVRNVVGQIKRRVVNLPGFTQKIYIDVRGQEYTQEVLERIARQILERAPEGVDVIIEFIQ
ncbi:MAG: DUF6531 domain-containing protein [Bulleidia sp.]